MEMATNFYDAELYHQKWLLQRKADWFKRLEVDALGLLDGQPASRQVCADFFILSYVIEHMFCYFDCRSEGG